MTQLHSQSLKLIFVLFLTFTLFFSTIVAPPVSAQSKLAAPATHVSDAAGVVSDQAKQQLENILGNLQQRSDVNFVVLTVQTTRGQDIFVYSAAVARDWNIGLLTNAGKSLLLVVSVDEKAVAIQASKQVRRDFPEGLVADVNDLMRGPVNSGRVGDGLLLAVQRVVSALSVRLGFSTEGIEQPVTAAAAPSPVTTGDAPQSIQPTPSSTPADDSKTPPVAKAQNPDTGSQISDSKSQSSDPATDKPATKKTGAKGTKAKGTTTTEDVAKESASKTSGNRRGDSATEPAKTSAAKTARQNTPEDDAKEAEVVEEMSTFKVEERIEKLKDFITTHPQSKSKARATEMLVVARAALGDDKLKAGETAAGVELLFLALGDATPDMPNRLFSGVVSQIPLNLYARGLAPEALKAAQQLEAKVADNPKRLLALAGFYLEIERGDQATRIAEQVVKLAPDLAEARNALGLALHISLRLDDAAAEYKHALELDPKTRGARRALADLDRSAGKFEEALALYREQLAAEPEDKPAGVGLVISLFELGKVDEAKTELQAAIKKDPNNLLLLTGAAYWLVAHGESTLALTLAQKAARLEPRYTWAQIALARSLVAQKQPLYAERSIRFARQYGRFPTLEYELASTLASVGLYEEASQTLLHSFTLKDGQIETQLANRIPARGASFPEVLALERRASIFQPTAADTEDNARILKSLLALSVALNPGADAKIDEASAATAAREFAAGKDEMRAFRQLYAASRLLQHGVALQTVQELTDSARDGVDAAIFVPAVTVAVQADELADLRAQAIAAGGTPDVPEAPRNVLANILRGRIEELSGWALFNQDKTAEAVEHLRRAVGILPVGTPLWQTSSWHLGVALQQAGNDAEALASYIKSYTSGVPDPARRSIIEQLYKKINGSLDGLDDRIGPAALVTKTIPAPTTTPTEISPAKAPEKINPPLAAAVPTPGPTPTPAATEASPAPSTPSPAPAAAASPTASPESAAQPSPLSESTPAAKPTPAAEPTPSPSSSPNAPNAEATPSPQPTPAATPEPTPTPAATPEAAPTPEPSAAPTPTPEPSRSPEPTPTPTPESTPAPQATPTPDATPALPSAPPTPPPGASPTPAPESTPTEKAAPTPSPTPSSDTRPRRVRPPQ